MATQVRPAARADHAWIVETLTRCWGGSLIVAAAGRVVDASRLPALIALIAGERAGLATYQIASADGSAEMVTLNALTPGCGIGTALVEALVSRLREAGIGLLRVCTTNDNLDALRFYQRRGFGLTALRPGLIDDARRAKPRIPPVGLYGIPMRDQLELTRVIDRC